MAGGSSHFTRFSHSGTQRRLPKNRTTSPFLTFGDISLATSNESKKRSLLKKALPWGGSVTDRLRESVRTWQDNKRLVMSERLATKLGLVRETRTKVIKKNKTSRKRAQPEKEKESRWAHKSQHMDWMVTTGRGIHVIEKMQWQLSSIYSATPSNLIQSSTPSSLSQCSTLIGTPQQYNAFGAPQPYNDHRLDGLDSTVHTDDVPLSEILPYQPVDGEIEMVDAPQPEFTIPYQTVDGEVEMSMAPPPEFTTTYQPVYGEIEMATAPQLEVPMPIITPTPQPVQAAPSVAADRRLKVVDNVNPAPEASIQTTFNIAMLPPATRKWEKKPTSASAPGKAPHAVAVKPENHKAPATAPATTAPAPVPAIAPTPIPANTDPLTIRIADLSMSVSEKAEFDAEYERSFQCALPSDSSDSDLEEKPTKNAKTKGTKGVATKSSNSANTSTPALSSLAAFKQRLRARAKN